MHYSNWFFSSTFWVLKITLTPVLNYNGLCSMTHSQIMSSLTLFYLKTYHILKLVNTDHEGDLTADDWYSKVFMDCGSFGRCPEREDTTMIVTVFGKSTDIWWRWRKKRFSLIHVSYRWQGVTAFQTTLCFCQISNCSIAINGRLRPFKMRTICLIECRVCKNRQ